MYSYENDPINRVFSESILAICGLFIFIVILALGPSGSDEMFGPLPTPTPLMDQPEDAIWAEFEGIQAWVRCAGDEPGQFRCSVPWPKWVVIRELGEDTSFVQIFSEEYDFVGQGWIENSPLIFTDLPVPWEDLNR